MSVDVIVLAAGRGTRMNSALPKVLHELAGRPLLAHVLETAVGLPGSSLSVVVGFGVDQVKARFPDNTIQWVLQREQLGTAHAVAQALPQLRTDSKVLILYGDVPLIQRQTLDNLLTRTTETSLALLTVELDNPAGYGRILRDKNNVVRAIVEQKDASPEQLAVREVNTGVMCLPSACLREWLPRIEPNNAQNEYYLTDLIAIARDSGFSISTCSPASAIEVEGVNSRAQLAQMERRYQLMLAEHLMSAGVGLADPSRFDCRGQLTCCRDVFIDVNCVFEGTVHIEEGAHIGPNCLIADARIGKDVVIKANTVIQGVAGKAGIEIGDRAQVGPFARLREGTTLSADVRIGNFVETKNSLLGPGSKANHLSYVGDTRVGENVNIGAGTITCNYDGVNKHETHIDDGAFIGSNSALVAPVTIGANATVGAGSTITKAVPPEHLAVGRGKQRNVQGWPRPGKNEPGEN